jgi:hypothetical protein
LVLTRSILARAALASLTMASIGLVPDEAHAQANHRLAPVGGRTTLVGGTGLAYGYDSAAAFLNPATVVRVDSGRLAFSVNFYQLLLVSAPSWYQPGPVDQRFGNVPQENAAIKNFDFDSLPGSLCLYFRVADVPVLASARTDKELRDRRARLGMCLATVENNTYAYNDEGYEQPSPFGNINRQAGNIRQTYRRFSIGPTYSMYIDNALAVGASFHFNRTSHRSIIGNSSTLYSAGGPISSALYNTSRGDAHALSLTLGATYRIGRRQTVAAVIELPSLHLFGSGGIHNFNHFDGAAGSGTTSLLASGPFATQTPLRVAIGTGVEGSWGTAEINVSFHTPVAEAYRAELEGHTFSSSSGATLSDSPVSSTFSARSRGAVNIGLGGEYFLSPGLSVLGGFGTDISAVPRGALGKDPFNYFPADTHRVFTSVGVGTHGEGGDLLIGGELSYGWGDRLAPNAYVLPARVETTTQRQYALMLVLAGSTSLRNIKRTVDEVTRAIDPSGSKKPVPP